LEDKILIRT